MVMHSAWHGHTETEIARPDARSPRLIAMMAKTFDNVWEAQETNYIYLFAQTVAEWQAQPLVPPPINLLSLPYEIVAACHRPREGAPTPSRRLGNRAPEPPPPGPPPPGPPRPEPPSPRSHGSAGPLE